MSNNNHKGRFALLEIDKYHSIEWGVNCVFQSDRISVAQAMKVVKEDAEWKARELKDEDDISTKETVYKIIDLLDS